MKANKHCKGRSIEYEGMGVLIGNGEFMQTSWGACSNNYRRLGTKMGAMGYKGINKVILGEKSKNVQYHSPQLSISKLLMDSVRCDFFFFSWEVWDVDLN